MQICGFGHELLVSARKNWKSTNLLVLMPLLNFQIVRTAKRFVAVDPLAYTVVGN